MTVTAAVDDVPQVPSQQPPWPDPEDVSRVRAVLADLPGVVRAGDVERLRGKMGSVARGEAFLLHAGECAETFDRATDEDISGRLKTLLQMGAILATGAAMPVVKVGRIAGQFAKPRTRPTETRGAVTLPAYRGDMVNGHDFTPEARRADPARMIRAYHASLATVQRLTALLDDGFADLRRVQEWNRGFIAGAATSRYERVAEEIERALTLLSALAPEAAETRTTELWTSHEALVFDYEEPLTREVQGHTYGLSGHLLWAGVRTSAPDGPHVAMLSRLRNPVAVKVGPNTRADDLLRLADVLDPGRDEGRLTFITRMGAERLGEQLPALLDAVRADHPQVSWVCDPMHGNTITSASGVKTRLFDAIVSEVCTYFAVHEAAGTVPAGISLELTGTDVTECLGGADFGVRELGPRYEAVCDPRLNHQQSLELAFAIAEMLRD